MPCIFITLKIHSNFVMLKFVICMITDKLWDIDGALQVCIESAHKEFSKQALTVMLDDGKLSLHLQAMRRYMLLGSGDFIKLLMEYAS
jgi:Gamma tubulin complex component C-terminal